MHTPDLLTKARYTIHFLQFRLTSKNGPFSLERNPQHPGYYLLEIFVKKSILLGYNFQGFFLDEICLEFGEYSL